MPARIPIPPRDYGATEEVRTLYFLITKQASCRKDCSGMVAESSLIDTPPVDH
jgi:hypothetical protein